MEIRTFTPTDWMGFGGALSFADGHYPLIADSDPAYVAVMGGEAIEVSLTDPDCCDEPVTYQWPVVAKTAKAARLIMRGVTASLNVCTDTAEMATVLDSFGFDRMN